jgi:TonB family protein
VAELYPETDYAAEAEKLLHGKFANKQQPEAQPEEQDSSLFASEELDSIAIQDSIARAIEAEIAELPLMDKPPTSTGEFVYPISAYNDLWEGSIKFKIKMDFTGKVEDWQILQGSGYEDVDEAAAETLKDTYFNPADVDPLLYGKWFLYVYNIRLPDELRRDLNK